MQTVLDCTDYVDVIRAFPVSHRLPRDNQRDNEQQTLLKLISSHMEYIPVWEQLATDQFDPWQVVPIQVFTSYSSL